MADETNNPKPRPTPNPGAAPPPTAAAAPPDPFAVPATRIEETPRKRPKRLERNEITLNLVAMLDMAFNILIFFILTANFAVGEGVLTAKLPASGSGGTGGAPVAEIPKNPIVINVASAGDSYSVNIEGSMNSTRDFTELQTQLNQMQSDPSRGFTGPYKPDNPVIIKPDGEVRWQHVVNAFNAAISARYSDISFSRSGG
ncbi:MAG: biopolymer transporter ExbD [Planctomycetes bacterium]|nr:biopolymer transporter ExbD [Planctomycetota bacterium]